jgi:hypothetical protein
MCCGLHVVDNMLWTLKHMLWIVHNHIVDNNDECVVHNIGNVIHNTCPQRTCSLSTICVDPYVVGTCCTCCGSPVIYCGLHVVDNMLCIL